MSAAALLQNKSWKESEIGENFCVEGIIPLNISRIKALCLQTHMLIPARCSKDDIRAGIILL